MSNTIWQFDTKNFTIRMSWEYDNDPDLSWADAETMDKINSGEWSCYTFHSEVIERATGNVIGEDYLGGSIYARPEEFRDHVGLAIKAREDGHNYGSYFMDMIRQAIDGARMVYEVPRPKLRQPEAQAPKLSLYLVVCDDGINNWDMHVWAQTPEQARSLWADNWEFEILPDGIKTFLVDTAQPENPGVAEWHKLARA